MCFFGAGGEDGVDLGGVGGEFGALCAQGGEVVPVGVGEALFEVAVAAAAVLVVGDHLGVVGLAGEELVEGEDDGVLGGLGFFDLGGVGLDFHDELPEGLFFAEDGEGVVVAFAHFFAIESGDFGGAGADAGFGHDEGVLAVEVVNFSDEVAGDLEVLFLILTDGDDVGIVEEDVGGHEGGVGEEGVVRGEAFRDFILIRMAPFEEAHGADGGEDPGEFVHGGDGALFEEDRFGGIESAGEEVDGDAADIFAKRGGFVGGGHGVVVGDEVVAIALGLGVDGGFHGAKVITDVEAAAGLEPGQNSHLQFL